ncbi:MAG: substrate-binding domain-containing protein [Elusimicrobia bacterium]|nr:substrate-binding domain-containing protein [Elusimicrobiota bacterium]
MKKWLAAVVSLVLVVSFLISGCKKSAGKGEGKIKIGFILGTEQEERYQRDKKSFIETAESLDSNVIFLSSNNDELIQANAVDSILSQGVSVLVLQPVDSDNAGVFVDKAHAKGVKVIAYDRMINHPKLDFYAGQDSFAVGKMQANSAIEWMKKHGGIGKVMICSGQQGHSVAEAITSANIEVLKKAKVKIAAQQYHNAWGTDEALNTVENILVRTPDIKAILCNNSGMARGAIQAVEKAGKIGQIFISGADADRANIEYIIEGKQQQDVYKDEITLAATAAKLAISLSKGEQPKKLDKPTTYKSAKNIKTILTPVKSVTKENYKDVVIKAGPKYKL